MLMVVFVVFMLMFFILGMNMNIVRLAACQTLDFKLTHIQQQFKRYVGVGCFNDACLGDDLPDEIRAPIEAAPHSPDRLY